MWTKNGIKKESRFFTDLNEAIRHAESQSAIRDVYFGIGLGNKAKRANERFEANEVAALPGLWAEVDYLHPVHKKKNLPPTAQDAIELLNRMPVSPSVIVHSGHGLQAYWLFERVESVKDDKQRAEFAQLNERWQKHLKALARAKGWDIDSTHDLARVFRIPGTKNHKNGKAVEVRVIANSQLRYKPSELLNKLNAVVPIASTKVVKDDKQAMAAIGLLRLDANAKPPQKKFDALCSLEPRFLASWNRKRSIKDLPDQTPSGYDLALANFTVEAGWSNQEIADLMIASRRKRGEDLKLGNKQYFVRTIAKAREKTKPATELRLVEDKNDSEQDAEQLKAVKKRKALKLLRDVYPVGIKRVIKRGATNSTYEIELEDDTLMPIGTASDLIDSPKKLQVAFADILGIALPKKFSVKMKFEDGETTDKPLLWGMLFQAILDASEIIETSSEAEETLGWLNAFVVSSSLRGSSQQYMTETMPTIDYNDKETLFATLRGIKFGANQSLDSPHSVKGFFTKHDNRCHLHIATFVRFINFNAISAERMTPQKLSVRLTRLGFYRKDVGARQGAEVVSLKLYLSPSKFSF